MMPRVVIIGAMGMLGQALLTRLLRAPGFHTVGTYHRAMPARPSKHLIPFDVVESSSALADLVSRADVIVNCAVSLSSSMKAENYQTLLSSIQVNSVFPKLLSKEAERQGARVIHISSDAVFSGCAAEPLSEDAMPDPIDLYGMSKLLGEEHAPNTINIRTSIVGFDKTYHRGLLEWFLSHKAGTSVQGFINHTWQGVTTLQLADLITGIVQRQGFDDIRQDGPVHHFCPNEAVSKFELLGIFNRVFERDVIVEPSVAANGKIDRRLKTKFTSMRDCYHGPLGIADALEELRESQL